jgi:ArsR family transcriptional regulator, arsenate/arsenite/antimonite-responsive transcriptional repressor
MSTAHTVFDHQIEEASAFFKLVSDANRLKVLAILSYGECTVTDIYACLKLKQNLISHHLSCLTAEGVVRREKRGRFVFYSLKKDSLLRYKEVMYKLVRAY